MSNLPTFNCPIVIQHQMFKRGRWSSQSAIHSDMSMEYALLSLENLRKIMPEHNWRLLSMEIIT